MKGKELLLSKFCAIILFFITSKTRKDGKFKFVDIELVCTPIYCEAIVQVCKGAMLQSSAKLVGTLTKSYLLDKPHSYFSGSGKPSWQSGIILIPWYLKSCRAS